MLPGAELRSKVEEMSPVKRHSGISPFQDQYEVWLVGGRERVGRGREGGEIFIFLCNELKLVGCESVIPCHGL